MEKEKEVKPSGFEFGVTGAQTTIAPPVFSFPTASTGQPSTQPAALFSLSSQPKFSWRNQNEGEKPEEIPVLSTFPQGLDSAWRDVQWTEEQKTTLMKTVSSYRPKCEEVPQARVLLLGPLHSGKSSFISSVQSLFNGRVSNRAMVGSFFPTSFTKKLQSFSIHTQKREENTGLVLCDIPGLGDGEVSGLTLHDILSVIKGHVPEGHKFSPGQPVVSETDGYVKSPSLKEKIHCVAFVVDASRITSYSKGLGSTFKQLREHISDLCVHQVALLTHVDKVCPKTARDVSEVYRSLSIKETMSKAGALLGMSTSYIVPVKNYSSELDLDVNTDVLLLSAVDHILNYADLFFQDHMPQNTGQKFKL
ncbi:interferon-induced protein 44-like isoform X1 [Nothobranchius furzeri]|uniref:Interferon-induced protein 44-like n=1 Tax=Nothobranchius furzeri TaxID=105023 RepID=A0A1A8BAZ4_NOTFU|nr:transcript variant X1 [Nothobranchius furzeri]